MPGAWAWKDQTVADKKRSWLRIALEPPIVKRSLKIAAVVGTILMAINYGDHILSGSLTRSDCVKMIVTYFVPYCVSTYASVSTVIARGLD